MVNGGLVDSLDGARGTSDMARGDLTERGRKKPVIHFS